MKIFIIISLCAALSLNAQNHSYYNDFFDNSVFNTAYNNLNKGFKLVGVGYKNFSAPYMPGYFCLNGSYTTKSNINIGARMVNKYMMFQSFIQGDIIIGHRVSLTAKDSIALSFNGGIASNSFNGQYLNQYTEIDPYIDVFNKTFYNVGASMLYTHENRIEIGVGVPSIVTSNNGVRPLVFSNAAYNHKMKDYLLRPQVIYFVSDYTSYADFSCQLKYKNLMWGKFAYNTLGTSSYGMGLNLKFAELGYAFRLNSGEYGQNLRGLHMVSVTIRPK